MIEVRFSGLRTDDGGKAAGMSYLCLRFNSLEGGYQRGGGLTTKNATSDKYTNTRQSRRRGVKCTESFLRCEGRGGKSEAPACAGQMKWKKPMNKATSSFGAAERSLSSAAKEQRNAVVASNELCVSVPVTDPHAPSLRAIRNPRLRRERFGHHGSQRRSRPAKQLTQLMTLIEESALRCSRIRVRQQRSHDFRQPDFDQRRLVVRF